MKWCFGSKFVSRLFKIPSNGQSKTYLLEDDFFQNILTMHVINTFKPTSRALKQLMLQQIGTTFILKGTMDRYIVESWYSFESIILSTFSVYWFWSSFLLLYWFTMFLWQIKIDQDIYSQFLNYSLFTVIWFRVSPMQHSIAIELVIKFQNLACLVQCCIRLWKSTHFN